MGTYQLAPELSSQLVAEAVSGEDVDRKGSLCWVGGSGMA